MTNKHQVSKRYLKTWCIGNYYNYKIFEVDAGRNTWLMAEPITKGVVTRTAEDENILRILLENDVRSSLIFQQRVR